MYIFHVAGRLHGTILFVGRELEIRLAGKASPSENEESLVNDMPLLSLKWANGNAGDDIERENAHRGFLTTFFSRHTGHDINNALVSPEPSCLLYL